MYHPPHMGAPPRSSAVVLCNPFGYEAICAYRAYCHLAERLAATGFPVLRFDYHGTGDSSGQDDDPDRVRAWLDSVAEAARELKARSQQAEISLFGVRLGATLAAAAAAELDDVASLVLWAPCATGRAYVREMRASQLIKQGTGGSADKASTEVEGDVEASGFLLTRATVEELSRLELATLRAPLAGRVLILARGNSPTDERLAGQLQARGNATVYRNIPGFAEMMVDQVHRSIVPTAVIDDVVGWIVAGEAERRPATPPGVHGRQVDGIIQLRAPAVNPASAHPVQRETNDSVAHLSSAGAPGARVREQPVVFGGEQRLFGILTEPLDVPPSRTRRPAILMLNVGTNHRVGPNRLYVKMARTWAARGYAVLRFDLAGIGDSRVAEGYAASRLYSKASISDVQAAMTFLEGARKIDRFVLLGLCSGAYVAFHTALADARVAGEVLINTATFSWKPGDPVDATAQRVYKSTHFYRRALFDVTTWKRAWRREIDVRGIADRLWRVALTRAKAKLASLGRSPDDDLATSFRTLAQRGTDSLLIYGEDDQGLDYLEVHLGSRARRLRALDNFRVDVIDGPDHTFTQLWAQTRLTEFITDHLVRRFG